MLLSLRLHPFFFFVISFISGIIIQEHLSFKLSWALWTLLSAIGFFWHNKYKPSRISFHATLFFSALAIGGLIYFYKSTLYNKAHHEFHLLIKEKFLTEISVVIQSIDHQPSRTSPLHITCTIYHPLSSFHGYLLKIYTSKIQGLQVGDFVILPLTGFSSFKDKKCAWHFMRQAVISGTFSTSLSYRLITRPRFHFERMIVSLRSSLWSSLQTLIPRSTFFMLASLFGGSKDIDPSYARFIRNAFKKWGISHYLARSGAHLAIFVSLWALLFRLLPCWIIIREVFLILMIILYTLFSWSTLSFLRAFYMTITGYTLRSLHHQSTSLHIWSLVTFFTLFSNPYTLFFLDFQLSFGFSYALIWLAHIRHQYRYVSTFPQ